jgi:hypothetical protein
MVGSPVGSQKRAVIHRLEGQALVLLGQQRLDLRQRRPRLRHDRQRAGFVELDPRQPRHRQRLSGHRPSDGPRAAAQDAQRTLGRATPRSIPFTCGVSTAPAPSSWQKTPGSGGQTAPAGRRRQAANDPHAAPRTRQAGTPWPGSTASRIEHVLHLHLDLQVLGCELRRHQVALLDPHAMLAGQAAAHLDAELQDVRPEGLAGSRSPGLLASNRISGCMLPSPAWNTLATSSPYTPSTSRRSGAAPRAARSPGSCRRGTCSR